MRREYIDSMKGKGFGAFISACEDLKNCKYVLVESKITALLKTVADNKQLYAIFGTVLNGFDYKGVFNECVVGNGFKLPTEPKTAIALVFRILIDIDSRKMPLPNFLEAYFYSESVNESYARFALELLAPFLSYCRMYFVKTEATAPSVMEQNGMAQAYDDVNNKFREELRVDALACLSELIDMGDKTMSGVEGAEYAACLNGLIRSIKKNNFDDMISAFLGVKYAVAYFFKSNADARELIKKLEYDIRHLTD
ncbi:MAG: hypothetical protein J1F33_00260 [Clostridiales bacterium]|nr:hypothetical protein [Clostridiales bacterium]